jgi:NADP-dependent 3-hydroxy acid dehydrogenase YdfG
MQVLLVTGAGSGIGFACGIEFLKKNPNNCVTFVDRRFENQTQ